MSELIIIYVKTKKKMFVISTFESSMTIYIMRVCATKWLHYVQGIFTIACKRFLAVSVWRGAWVAAILRNSIKVLSNSAPRTKDNSGIEFQGKVIAIVLFTALRRRHGHYFSNYDVSRLPRNPYYYFTERRKTATEMGRDCSKDLPVQPRRPYWDEKSEVSGNVCVRPLYVCVCLCLR